jgi:hypothetical protein
MKYTVGHWYYDSWYKKAFTVVEILEDIDGEYIYTDIHLVLPGFMIGSATDRKYVTFIGKTKPDKLIKKLKVLFRDED